MKEIVKLRQKHISELQKELHKAKEELLRLRFEKTMGTLKKTHLLRQTRRKIARLLMLLKENTSQK